MSRVHVRIMTIGAVAAAILVLLSLSASPVHASTAIVGGEITRTVGLYEAMYVGTTSTCNTFASWEEGSNRRMFVQSTLAGASTETVLVDVNAGGQFGHCEPVSAIK